VKRPTPSSFGLLVLGLALATAPIATVPTGVAPRGTEADSRNEARAEPDGTPTESPSGTPKSPAAPERPQAPPTSSWAELTPSHQPVPGPSPDRDDVEAQRPELPPALYARRLAAVPRPPAPPEHLPRADVRSGHLDLPPPTA
jgi:hypothetical protein